MKTTIMIAIAAIPALAIGSLWHQNVQACAEHHKAKPTTAKNTVAGKTVAKNPVVKAAAVKKTVAPKSVAKKPVVKAAAKKIEPKKVEVPLVLNFKMKNLSEEDVDLSKYQGKVVMMVNVASKCGMTPQYQGLQDLHKKYSKEGLAILGFPANDFGQQEPGSNDEIAEFCTKNYGVEFDMFSKVAVTGENKTPLYKHLTSEETNPGFAGEVGWNFEKFLIGRDGKVVARFKSSVAPTAEEVTRAIEAELAKK